MSAADPGQMPERACAPGRGIDPDLFYPDHPTSKAAVQAREVCQRCPVVALCAEWAAPMARRGLLAGAVVAGVYVPGSGSRRPAAEELQAIAVGQQQEVAA